jgi:hypothetical protein
MANLAPPQRRRRRQPDGGWVQQGLDGLDSAIFVDSAAQEASARGMREDEHRQPVASSPVGGRCGASAHEVVIAGGGP